MAGTRLTAAQRSEEVLDAAITAFAAGGYAGTKTDVIRLFGTKQQLFLATHHRVVDRIEQIFREAAAEQPDLPTLGHGYSRFLEDRELLLVLLHGYAAASDPVIGDPVRERFSRTYDLIRDITGASVTDIRRFLATGMLLTVMAAMGLAGPSPLDCGWATEVLDDLEEFGD
jgi:AcrR family transcriptional regulator